MNTWQGITRFFNSNFFVALSTILTVSGAIIAYFVKKRQEKQQIACLLVNDIRKAEGAIQKLIDHSSDLEFPVISVLPQNSWNKYSYLFSRDFNQDDTEGINNFFSIAEEIEHIVKEGNKIDRFLLQVTQRSAAIQNSIVAILANNENKEVAETKFENFINKLDIGTYHYAPSGFQTDFNELLKNYRPLLGSHAGTVLKKIAKLQI